MTFSIALSTSIREEIGTRKKKGRKRRKERSEREEEIGGERGKRKEREETAGERSRRSDTGRSTTNQSTRTTRPWLLMLMLIVNGESSCRSGMWTGSENCWLWFLMPSLLGVFHGSGWESLGSWFDTGNFLPSFNSYLLTLFCSRKI